MMGQPYFSSWRYYKEKEESPEQGPVEQPQPSPAGRLQVREEQQESVWQRRSGNRSLPEAHPQGQLC